MPAKSFKKQITITGSITAAAVIIAAIALALTSNDLGGVARQIEEKRLELITQQRAVGALASLRADSKKAVEALPRLENAIILRDDLLAFKPEIQNLGAKNKVSLTVTFGPETKRKENEPGSIQFTIVAQGGYANLVQLMKDIETSRYFTSLDNFDIVRQNEESLSLTLMGRIFFR